MDTRTVGIEEELLLIDPETRAVSGRSAEVLKSHREHGSGRDPSDASDTVDQELLRPQVETRTDPGTDLDKLGAVTPSTRGRILPGPDPRA